MDDKETIDFSGADIKELYNEIFNTGDVVKEEPETTTESTANTKVNDVEDEVNDDSEDEEAVENDDLPWNEKKEDEENDKEEDDDDEFKELELNEKWRVKRLNKELDKRKAAEEETRRLKEELEQLKASTNTKTEKEETPTPEYKSQDEFIQAHVLSDPYIQSLMKKMETLNHRYKTEDFNHDLDMERTETLVELKAEMKSKHKEIQNEIREYQKEQQSEAKKQELEIKNTFESKLETVKETYPDILKAKSALESVADKLHIEIRRALLLDENAGELTWILGSSKKNINYLIEATKNADKQGRLPIDAIKYIGRLSADIVGKEKIETEDNKPKVPKSIKQKAAPSGSNDPYEWAKMVMEGKIKNPYKK